MIRKITLSLLQVTQLQVILDRWHMNLMVLFMLLTWIAIGCGESFFIIIQKASKLYQDALLTMKEMDTFLEEDKVHLNNYKKMN